MQNVKIKLTGKRSFLQWYKQFQSQCNICNIKLNRIDEMYNFGIGSAPVLSKINYDDKDVATHVGQLLLSKLNEEELISKKFIEGRKTL